VSIPLIVLMLVAMFAVAVPQNLAENLNGTNTQAELSLAPDPTVLTRGSSQVFQITRYSLVSS
jgi:hypothetical protein